MGELGCSFQLRTRLIEPPELDQKIGPDGWEEMVAGHRRIAAQGLHQHEPLFRSERHRVRHGTVEFHDR